MAALQRLALRGTPKATKAAARYTPAGGAERCGMCRHYVPSSSCARIEGPVSAAGWCMLFSRQVTYPHHAGVQSFGAGGPSLDLSFMNVGAMPAGVTFARASTATYFNSAGVMQTAAPNTPRWDYDPTTLALRGLLIEEARTNILLQSVDFTNAAWSKTSFGGPAVPVVTANQTVAPDGTTTADSIAFSAVSAGGAVLQQAYTGTANSFTLSVWLKGSIGGERLYLSTTPNGTTYYRTTATLTTTWQRFVLTTAALTAGTWYFQFGIDTRDGNQNFGPAQTIFAWGAQTEQAPFVSNYIPTTTAAVTRALDLATMPTSPWYNASAGSAAVTFTNVAWNAAAGINRGVFAFDDGAGTRQNTVELVGFVSASASVQLNPDAFAAGALTSAPAGPTIIGTASIKSAVAWGGATMAVSANGGPVISGALSGLPSTISRLAFGAGLGPLASLNGYIRHFSYWPRALSASELQSVTI